VRAPIASSHAASSQIVGVTDPLKLGFQQQAMIGVRCEASQLLEAAEVINAFPEVD
jgi:hypothetical protein